MEFYHQVNEANLRLLSGRPTKPVDALFFHDRVHGDFTNLFELAGEMYRSRAISFIATPNTDGARVGGNILGEASPGKDWTRARLLEQGLPSEGVIFHPQMPSHHTWEENQAFVELSMQMEWRSGILMAHPHQLLREMLGMIKAMAFTGYLMEIYTAAPLSTPWLEVTRVNQGIDEKMRVENIDDELGRIPTYQQKGDLATIDELFAYLEARERGSLRLTH